MYAYPLTLSGMAASVTEALTYTRFIDAADEPSLPARASTWALKEESAFKPSGRGPPEGPQQPFPDSTTRSVRTRMVASSAGDQLST